MTVFNIIVDHHYLNSLNMAFLTDLRCSLTLTLIIDTTVR